MYNESYFKLDEIRSSDPARRRCILTLEGTGAEERVRPALPSGFLFCVLPVFFHARRAIVVCAGGGRV